MLRTLGVVFALSAGRVDFEDVASPPPPTTSPELRVGVTIGAAAVGTLLGAVGGTAGGVALMCTARSDSYCGIGGVMIGYLIGFVIAPPLSAWAGNRLAGGNASLGVCILSTLGSLALGALLAAPASSMNSTGGAVLGVIAGALLTVGAPVAAALGAIFSDDAPYATTSARSVGLIPVPGGAVLAFGGAF